MVTCLLWGVVDVRIVEWNVYTRKQFSFWMEEACYWNTNESAALWACLFSFLVWLLLPSIISIIPVTGSYSHCMRTFHLPPYFTSVLCAAFQDATTDSKKETPTLPWWKFVAFQFNPRLRSRNLLSLWRRWDLSIAEVKPKVFLKVEPTNLKHNDHSLYGTLFFLRTSVSKNSNSTSLGRATHGDSNTPRKYNNYYLRCSWDACRFGWRGRRQLPACETLQSNQ